MIYFIFVIPIIFIISGYIMSKYPPKKINHFIGYRTRRSRKNQKAWDFANKYCGLLWINYGFVMLCLSLILFVLFYYNTITYSEKLFNYIVIGETIIMLIPTVIVENKLKDYQ